MAVEVTSLVWQLVEATAQLIKLMKSVTSFVFKKASAIVLRKATTKKLNLEVNLCYQNLFGKHHMELKSRKWKSMKILQKIF